MIDATTSILYALRYLLNLHESPIGNISIQSIFYDSKQDCVKLGLPECRKTAVVDHLSFRKDFEDLASVLRAIAEYSHSEPIQMCLLSAAEMCTTKTDVIIYSTLYI